VRRMLLTFTFRLAIFPPGCAENGMRARLYMVVMPV